MNRCYLSHPNNVTPAVLEAAKATLEAAGWEVVDPTAFGKEMASVKPWEWEYGAAFFLTTNPDHVVGKGQFQDFVTFAGRQVPMYHLGTNHRVVGTRKVKGSRNWRTFAELTLAPEGWQQCPGCYGTGEAGEPHTGQPCMFCGGKGVTEVTP